jgi:hypothetical protein
LPAAVRAVFRGAHVLAPADGDVSKARELKIHDHLVLKTFRLSAYSQLPLANTNLSNCNEW